MPVLRGHLAGRDRRARRALARAHRRPREGASRRPDGLEAPAGRLSPTGAAGRHVPLDLDAPRSQASPALAFADGSGARVELSPADAQRLALPRRGPCWSHGEDARGEGRAARRDACRKRVPRRQRLPRRGRRRSGSSARLLARRRLLRGLVDPDHQGVVIFAVALQIVPIVLLAERKLLGRFQGRYGPTASVRSARCSRWPTSSSC